MLKQFLESQSHKLIQFFLSNKSHACSSYCLTDVWSLWRIPHLDYGGVDPGGFRPWTMGYIGLAIFPLFADWFSASFHTDLSLSASLNTSVVIQMKGRNKKTNALKQNKKYDKEIYIRHIFLLEVYQLRTFLHFLIFQQSQFDLVAKKKKKNCLSTMVQ